MYTFTLDTNCIIAVEKQEPAALAIRALADAHAVANAHVVVAVSASERQKPDREIANFNQFCERLSAVGLGHLAILRPMAYWGVTFWDWSVWASDQDQIERQLHQVLFPDVEFLWEDYCQNAGLDRRSRWRNYKCDVQMLWAHIHEKRDVFVTSEHRFHKSKKAALIALGANRIECPKDAASRL
jgi:hypothetical protein